MLPSFAPPSSKINIDAAYDTLLDPYDCRGCGKSQDGGHTQPASYPVPASVQLSPTRPQGVRRSSEPIVSSHIHQPPPYFPSDSDGVNSSEWVFHHHHHHHHHQQQQQQQQQHNHPAPPPPNNHNNHNPSQQAVENYPVKLEHPIEAQGLGSFTDVASSINNTRNNFNHMNNNPSYLSAPPLYPPPYSESLAGWNDPSYDMQLYYDHRVPLQYPMDTTPDQINYDHQAMSDNLHHVNGYSTTATTDHHHHHHHPSSLNQTHVSNNNNNNNNNNLQHLNNNNLPTAAVGSGQSQLDVTATTYLISSDEPVGVVPRVFDHHGCVEVPQLAVHSEQPPLSSYSELSAHMKYYSTFNSSPSQPAKATATAMGHSQPRPTSAWKGSNHHHTSSASLSSQDMDTLPPQSAPQALHPPPSSSSSSSISSSISRTFEPWTALPPQPQPQPPSSHQHQHHRKIKTEGDPLTSLAMPSKRFGSPDRPARSSSSSSESRRSRTLSPNSRSQGMLKTIMMKRGGSEPKKQNLACLFCRERKIACGRPAEGSLDPTCNQCARRSLVCQYPTESRRGQHKRSKKNQQDHGHNVERAK